MVYEFFELLFVIWFWFLGVLFLEVGVMVLIIFDINCVDLIFVKVVDYLSIGGFMKVIIFV